MPIWTATLGNNQMPKVTGIQVLPSYMITKKGICAVFTT